MSMPASIHPFLPIISESSAAIESAFLSAGRGLSLGLTAFKSLTDSLTALGAELDGGSTASASLSLGRMSRTLRDIGERWPVDGAVLGDLLGDNQAMTRKFDDLVGDMRMMVIVSRSARLEAVVSDEQRISLEEFSRTIDHQIGDVQRRIHLCASEHAKLTGLLERAARAHLALDAGFRDRLGALAAELDDALGLIQGRRDVGIAFMKDATARARGITQAAGMALVSLQIGDNTRQRLEHVHFALERAEAAETGGDGSAAGAATADLFCRLGEAQLRDTVTIFEAEASSILQAFVLLGRETASLVSTGRATYGDAVAGDTSFMGEFRTRFATATDIVGACDTTRQAVEQAIAALRAMLDTLDEMLTSLGETGQDLTIVAMNVGLEASRLGSKGRGLVTVSGELKRLANQISHHADALLSAFRTVRHNADHFGGAAADSPDRSLSLDGEAAAILEDLARGDARIAEVLRIVERTGEDLDATVAGAARDFEAVVADMVRLTDTAEALGRRDVVDGLDDEALATAARTADDLMLPLYSMTQERDVHAAVVGASAGEPVAAVDDWAA